MNHTSKKQEYRQFLLDHFHNPRGKDDIPSSYVSSASRNPMCGDEVVVGVNVDATGQTDIRFMGRGCSVCISSASIMVEVCAGKTTDSISVLLRSTTAWLENDSDILPEHESVQALDSVRHLPARQRCMLLAWEALAESIKKAGSNDSPGI